jgi:hypothetical protein
MKTKLLSLTSALLLCLHIQAQANLIYNGDFSLGNVGFTSGQTYSDFYNPCDYYVGSTWFNTSFPVDDHTPTTDNMFMSIDGCFLGPTTIYETTVSTETQANYNFSFWASRADAIQPQFEIHLIGNVTGDMIAGTTLGIPYTGVDTWDEYAVPMWNSGINTSVVIRIVNLQTDGYGNDFRFDDVFFGKDAQGGGCTYNDLINVPNLISNGNFASGNTGFTSEQTHSDLYTPCDYYVGSTWFNTSYSFTDHTPTADNMFMSIDGCYLAPTVIYQATVPVEAVKNYKFSFWASRAEAVQPNFEIHLIGNVTGDLLAGTIAGIPYTGVAIWDEYTVPVWNPGDNTSVVVKIINLETESYGNDFGLDDVSLKECNSATTGVNDVSSSAQQINLAVYPNPAVSEIIIQSASAEKLTADIMDITGKVLIKAQSFVSTTSVDVQQLPQGIYFVRLQNASGQTVATQKLIVSR